MMKRLITIGGTLVAAAAFARPVTNDLGKIATSADIVPLQERVIAVENFVDGSNVTFVVTNYQSGVYLEGVSKLKIRELRDGQYRTIYDSKADIDAQAGTKILAASNAILGHVNQEVNMMRGELAAKADLAWGKYTSAGGMAPSNQVYITAPETVFAGGMEWERTAVGLGGIYILVDKGQPTYTTGSEGVFHFQDFGGTNYFGFAKSDSYTIGADAAGITVANHLVTITYNVTMQGVPCLWYTEKLDPMEWVQLNTPDGEPISGAPKEVNWDTDPGQGKQIARLNCTEPSGFFKATIEVQGAAKFETNMPADIPAFFCTDDPTKKVKIEWNNGNPRIVEAQ